MTRVPARAPLAAAALLLALAALPAPAQDLAAFEKRLTTHRLENGLTFLILEREGAPVVSFYTYVDVGAAQEVPGVTGIAHMFEHMAFKGTSRIGTSNYKAEKKVLDAIDDAYRALDTARRRPGGADAGEVERLERRFKELQEEADRYVVKNEFGEIIDREGGVGLNASTSSDKTDYYYSLPANKVELWAYLESERFLDPVFREFYQERDVVMEERRLRTENQPAGRLREQFLSAAFVAHPYKQPVVGYMSDLQSFSREDAEAFYRTHYVPANMVIAIVGAVKAKQILPVLDRYFGRLPRRPPPPPLRTVEPPAIAEKTIVQLDRAQPLLMEGYHRPAVTDPDDAVYDAIAEILASGRTSRLYRGLVRDQKLAARVSAFNGMPGTKYPHLFVFYAAPAPGRTAEEVGAAIHAELERLKTGEITDEELRMVKTRARAGLIRTLDSDIGIARQLAFFQQIFGDWRELFRSVARIEAVTQEDVRRVAAATFTPANRVSAMIASEPAAPAGRAEEGR